MKKTRRERAQELLATLEHGPEFDATFVSGYKPMHARDQYLIWVETWVVPEVKKLIPELEREAKDKK